MQKITGYEIMSKIKTIFILLICVLISLPSVYAVSDLNIADKLENTISVSDIESSIENSTINTEVNPNDDIQFTKNEVLKNVIRSDVQVMAMVSLPSTFNMSEIAEAGIIVKQWTDSNGKLPNYVTIANVEIAMPEFYYLLAEVVVDKYNTGAVGSPITIKYDVINPSNPSGVSVSGSLTKAEYAKNAQAILNFINNNNQAPNYVLTALGKMQYQTSIYMYCKILQTTYNTGTMPTTVSISVASSYPMNQYMPTYNRSNNSGVEPGVLPIGTIPSSIYNDVYIPGSLNLNNYLVATKNCQVNDPTLKSLAMNLTIGKTTQVAQATAIFNWVKNNIVYSGYTNTLYGAKGTYNIGKGNCVDQSHLLIALYRAAGFPARYINGNCNFIVSGRIGHTWTQVLINNTWVVGDTTNKINSFGIINSWNSPNIYGKYYEISLGC